MPVETTDAAVNVQFAQNESLDASARGAASATLTDRATKVRLETNTPSGAAWLEKYLHPPSPKGPGYAGIPDRNAGPAVDYEFRLEDEINLSTAAGFLANSNALIVFSPPSILRQRMTFVTNGITYAQVPPANAENNNMNYTSWNANAEAWRMTYLSDTFEQDATALNNAGMLYGAQFKPNVTTFLVDDIGFDLRFGKHEGYNEFLKLIPKTIAHLKATVGKQGLRDATFDATIQVISLGVFPLSGGDVLMRTPKSQSWRSTVGGYLPHRFSEPTQKYMSQVRQYTSIAGAGASVPGAMQFYVCAFETYTPLTDTWKLQAFLAPDSATIMTDVGPWYDMTWSVLLYDFSAQIGSGSSFGFAPLVHKKIVGIEAQPPFGSINQAIMRGNPMLDQKAIDISSTHDIICPDMYPAAANAGGFLGVVSKWAPSILNTLGSVFGAVTKANKNSSEKNETVLNKRLDAMSAAMDAMLNSQVIEKMKKKEAKKMAKGAASKQ